MARPERAGSGRHSSASPDAGGCLCRADGEEVEGMKHYLALIAIDLKLALRQRTVIFFNYLFPLLVFFGFAQLKSGDSSPDKMTFILRLSISLGVLGSGLFGAGIRAFQERA